MGILGHNIYENIRTRTLVLHHHALLLFPPEKHGGIWGTGAWGLPGGGLEPGESLADCAAREVSEETGITVEVGVIAFMQEWVTPRYSPPPGGGEGYGYGLEVFHYAFPVAPVPEPRAERAGIPIARWMPLTVVPELPIFPTQVKVLCRRLARGELPRSGLCFVGRLGESPWAQPEGDPFA